MTAVPDDLVVVDRHEVIASCLAALDEAGAGPAGRPAAHRRGAVRRGPRQGRGRRRPIRARLAGALLPFGGHKGANIALLVELRRGPTTTAGN